MKFTEHQLQLAQGALFLIDNIGKPPPNTSFRDFTNQAISGHLQRHTYYHQPRDRPGPENRILVTAPWMRQYFNTRWMRKHLPPQTESSFYPSQLKGDDFADTLFRKGSTDGFPTEVLEKYGYNKATFSEAALPGYTPQIEESEHDENALGGYGEHGNKTSAARNSSPSSNSQMSHGTAREDKDYASSGEEELESKSEEEEDDERYSDVKDGISESEFQFPMGASVEASASPPVTFDPAVVEEMPSETEGFIQQVEPPKKRGRGRPRKEAVPESAQRSLHSVVGNTGASRSSSHSGSVFLNQQPRARPLVKPGKRKARDADLGDSNEDGVTIEPPATKKIKTSIKIGRNAGKSTAVTPGAASPPGASSKVDASKAPEADVVPGASPANDAHPIEEEVKGSRSPPTAMPGQNFQQQPQSATFDIDKQGRDFGRFYHLMERATDEVIDSIGSIKETLCFLDESPSERLEALYKRCWGPDWQRVRVELTKSFGFLTPDVTMSVMSAFLFEDVLNQQASIHDIRTKQLELKGTMGRAILRTLDLENGGHNLAEVARIIESEDARITIAEGEKSRSLQHQLRAEAEKFAKELWDIMVPHFRSVSRLARGYGMSSQRSEREWHEVFDENIIDLIEEILYFRLKLLATGCEQAYTWPEASESFDLRIMRNQGARLDKNVTTPEVLFTAFPGVKVRPPGSSKMLSSEGLKAVVKIKQPEKICTCGA